jgi:hypothetical protein
MAKRHKRVLTKNAEIYKKLTSLNFMSEVVLTTVTDAQINKILNNINRDHQVISKEKIGNYVLLRKVGPLDFSVYFQKN